jgi:hypothetical protein
MADTAAHLVDRVLPDVPVRQWVLTLPFPLRAKVAFDSALSAAVRTLFVTTVCDAYRARAARLALSGSDTGAVTVTQRFGSALNLNPHYHSLLLDGVYHRPTPDGPLVFAPHSRLTDAMVDSVLTTFRFRLDRLLRTRGYRAEAEDLPEPQPCALTQLSLSALRAGGRPSRDGPTAPSGPGLASNVGVDRDRASRCAQRRRASRCTPRPPLTAGKRGDLEVLCRYILRPAVTQDRVRWRDDDTVEWTLSRPWSDGTTRLVFQPLANLARLAVLIPRPYVNDTAYHGVLAPAARWRPEVVAQATGGVRRPRRPCDDRQPTSPLPEEPASTVRPRHLDWAGLLWRSLATDVLTCTTCGDRRKVLALVQDPNSIQTILRHLGLTPSAGAPPTTRPRAPPRGSLDLSPTT